MLICDYCEQSFEECDCKTEQEEYGEKFSVCPHCGCEKLSEAYCCDVCDQYKPDGTQSAFSDATCGDCYSNTVEKIKEFGVRDFFGGELELFVDIVASLREARG